MKFPRLRTDQSKLPTKPCWRKNKKHGQLIPYHILVTKSELIGFQTNQKFSIHLYSPPVLECNYYSPKSSRRRLSGKLTLHSKFGELVHPTARRFKKSNSYQFSNDYYSAAAGSNITSVFGKTVKISRPKPE